MVITTIMPRNRGRRDNIHPLYFLDGARMTLESSNLPTESQQIVADNFINLYCQTLPIYG